MKYLNKKFIRDIMQQWKQFVSVLIMALISVSIYCGTTSHTRSPTTPPATPCAAEHQGRCRLRPVVIEIGRASCRERV